MAKDFEAVDTRGDVTSLLKDIRQISLEIETNASVYDDMDEAKMLYYTYNRRRTKVMRRISKFPRAL